jgi:hypothetical protein
MKLANIVPIVLMIMSSSSYSINIDGSLNDWGKLTLSQSHEICL